jgi:hypothetical protein
MPYITTALNDNNQYTLQATAATGNCACTVVAIKNTGSTSSEVLISPNGSRSIPNGAVRLVIFASVAPGNTGVFKITQSGQTLADLTIGGSAPVDLMVQIEVT